MGHRGNQLCPKYKGSKWVEIYKKGVFQGSQISDMRFVIHFGELMDNYEENLKEEFRIKRPQLITRMNKRSTNGQISQNFPDLGKSGEGD